MNEAVVLNININNNVLHYILKFLFQISLHFLVDKNKKSKFFVKHSVKRRFINLFFVTFHLDLLEDLCIFFYLLFSWLIHRKSVKMVKFTLSIPLFTIYERSLKFSNFRVSNHCNRHTFTMN